MYSVLIFRCAILRTRTFHTKVVDKIKSHILYPTLFEYRAVCEMMWNNMVQPYNTFLNIVPFVRWCGTIWYNLTGHSRQQRACQGQKTVTYAKCVDVTTALPRNQWLRVRDSQLAVHCPYCSMSTKQHHIWGSRNAAADHDILLWCDAFILRVKLYPEDEDTTKLRNR
jgi:hypothetical protein